GRASREPAAPVREPPGPAHGQVPVRQARLDLPLSALARGRVLAVSLARHVSRARHAGALRPVGGAAAARPGRAGPALRDRARRGGVRLMAARVLRRDELSEAVDYHVIWRPHPGPQTDLLLCPVPEICYGGARGGGKTDGAIGKWIDHAGTY